MIETFDVGRKPRQLFSILPSAFHFQPLALLRRSISDYGLRPQQPHTDLIVQHTPRSEDLPRSEDTVELAEEFCSETDDTTRKYALQGRPM